MITPPENDRPLIETFPWQHLVVAAGAWIWLWFSAWALGKGVTTSVMVALSSLENYAYLPPLIIGLFTAWALCLFHIQRRIRSGRNPSPVLFVAALLLTPLWPALCFWSPALVSRISDVELRMSAVSMLMRRIIELRIPDILAMLCTFGIGIAINTRVAHRVFNRTGEPKICRAVLSYPLALLPALLAERLAGTLVGMGVFGASANGLMLLWYRMQLKKEVANRSSEKK
jgi:hypothetical protein